MFSLRRCLAFLKRVSGVSTLEQCVNTVCYLTSEFYDGEKKRQEAGKEMIVFSCSNVSDKKKNWPVFVDAPH